MTEITDSLVLPADVLLVPVKDLTEKAREQVQAEEGDYAVTRPHSRTPARIVDRAGAELLKEFRKPTTIAQAVIRYSRANQSEPERTLEEAFPMLDRMVNAHLLVAADSEQAGKIQPMLAVGSRFGDVEILACLQTLEDTEVYQVRTAGGARAALKILRAGAGPAFARMLEREAAILERLDGGVGPKLIGKGQEDGRAYLLIEWCAGIDCSVAAAEMRRSGERRRLLALCGSILDAYARLHARSIIHSDIHPRNVLAEEDDSVKLIDFGVARIAGVENEFRRTHRAGVGFFYEPEYATAALAKQPPPYSSAAGEQYALAALLYLLVTGEHYLDFSLEKKEMLRQIAEDAPLDFARRGAPVWPELERVLAKALSKRPSERFASAAEFAQHLRAAALPEPEPEPESAAVAEPATEPADYRGARETLESVLAKVDPAGPLFTEGLAMAPKASVTFGAAGIAYALSRIACARESAGLLSAADLWAARAARSVGVADGWYNDEIEITPKIVGRVSPYHTASGVYAVRGLIGRAMADVVSQQSAVLQFVEAATAAPCENLDVTLGRCGTLLGAALLLDAVSGNALVDVSALREFGTRACGDVWARIAEFEPARKCREIQYSGIAHGWAGILYATMRWSKCSGAELPAGLERRLSELTGLAEQYGGRARWRWSTRARREEQDGAYMPGWCNGSAGFVHLWTLAHEMLGDRDYLSLAERAGRDAWETEGAIGNLCCGYAGQAYAMLALHRHTGEEAWLHRAQRLAQKAAESTRLAAASGTLETLGLRPESLYKGELGIAVLAADLERPEFAAMPFFGDEGWSPGVRPAR
jgi:eukaryotic-like serine/threonine-protein kinase